MTPARRRGAEARPLVVATVAGSDPSGGAGLQGDLAVIASYGLHGAGIPTAITVQGPAGVGAVHALPADVVAEQLRVVRQQLRPAALKLGMIPDAAGIEALAEGLADLACPVVLDPVLRSSGGVALLRPGDVPVLIERLLPCADLITPNIDEAAVLLGLDRAAVARDPGAAAEALRVLGPGAVLLTGGHGAGASAVDTLADDRGVRRFASPRVADRRAVHGTGCALSTSLAVHLALGAALRDAVRRAKADVRCAIAGARSPDRGARLLDFPAMGRNESRRAARR